MRPSPAPGKISDMARWHKEDGEWVVKVQGGDFPEHVTGTVVMVTAASGNRTRALLGEHIRGWMIKGGVHVDLYRVTKEDGQ